MGSVSPAGGIKVIRDSYLYNVLLLYTYFICLFTGGIALRCFDFLSYSKIFTQIDFIFQTL